MAAKGSRVDRLWYFTRNSAYVLFTKKDENIIDQQVLRNSDRPIKQIQEFWESDYFVSQVRPRHDLGRVFATLASSPLVLIASCSRNFQD